MTRMLERSHSDADQIAQANQADIIAWSNRFLAIAEAEKGNRDAYNKQEEREQKYLQRTYREMFFSRPVQNTSALTLKSPHTAIRDMLYIYTKSYQRIHNETKKILALNGKYIQFVEIESTKLPLQENLKSSFYYLQEQILKITSLTLETVSAELPKRYLHLVSLFQKTSQAFREIDQIHSDYLQLFIQIEEKCKPISSTLFENDTSEKSAFISNMAIFKSILGNPVNIKSIYEFKTTLNNQHQVCINLFNKFMESLSHEDEPTKSVSFKR